MRFRPCARNGVAFTALPAPFSAADIGGIRGIADTTRFHLRSVSRLASALMLTGELDENAFDRLLAQLEFGILARALELLNLPVRLNRGELLALSELGAVTPADVEVLTLTQLQQALGSQRAAVLRDRLSAAGTPVVRQT